MSDLVDAGENALAEQPFSESVYASCFKKDEGSLTKTLSLNPETGKVEKDGSQCSMSKGTVHTIEITTPAGFGRMLRSRKPNQAIAHGVSVYPKANITTKGNERFPKNGLPTISRTKKYYSYALGPALMMFDHDKARDNSVAENDDALKPYRPDELLGNLAKIHPELVKAASVTTPSTSACIYDKDGNELRGEGSGSHTYLFPQNGKDIPRYLKTMGKWLILSGLGRIEISRSGALLERTLVDLTVGSPERLDFVAGAVCEDGLVQKLPPPTVRGGDLLDTSTLPDLTDEEEAEYLATIERLKVLAGPLQKIVKEQYLDQESSKLSKERGISKAEARSIVESRQDHILNDGDVLYFQHLKEPVTVGEVLDNGQEYDGKQLADPLEPEYDGGSQTKAKFYWNDGKPIINSFAHGQIKYTFERFKKAEPNIESEEDAQWFQNAVKSGSVARFLDAPKPELDFVFADSLLAATVGQLVGPGAAGKSTLMILMLMATATGRDILPGVLTPTKPGKVLGIFTEDSEEVLHHRIRDIANALFLFDAEALNLLRENMCVVSVPGHDLRLFGKEQQNLAESFFYEVLSGVAAGIEGLRLLMIDPLSRFHDGEENDNGAGTYFVSLLEKIAQKTRAAIIFLHHVGKRAGYLNSEFNLDAAMSQDCARGASGLTNGVRWQCNLFGVPEKNAKNLLGVKDAVPGQYLAMRVSKKNYGKPEPVRYLERGYGGMLRPVEPILKDGCSYDVEEAVLGLVISVIDGQQLTKRLLADTYHLDWKKEHPELSRSKLDSALTGFITKGRLFEVEGRNKSGKKIWFLSTKAEPDEQKKTGLEPDREPDDFEPDKPDRTGQNAVRFNNMPKLHNKFEPDKNEPDEALSGLLSARNHGTVEPDKVPPYGGIYSRPVLTEREKSPMPIG
jgi:RecA-family ATPase